MSRPETDVLRATRDDRKGAGLGLDVAQHATWAVRDVAEGAESARQAMPAEFYTRWGNPTTQRLQTAVAVLERGEAALATGSGMGAIATAIMHFARGKKQVVAQNSLYAATAEIFHRFLPAFGVETVFRAGSDTDALCGAVTPATGLVYLETPANPTMDITDIRAVAETAADLDVPVLVDNTFASPLNQRPLELGATVSLHSMTKYLGGHSDATGGMVVADDATIKDVWGTYKLLGPTLAPHEAFLIHRGVKTLALRVRQHNENAMAVAEHLAAHPDVERVHYPGLEDHPGHEIAKRQMTGGFGGMLSFELRGGFEAGRMAMEAVELCVLGVSLGGVESLVQHPASMTHGPLSADERREAGIADGLVRLSVGIEHVDDIIADLDLAIRAAHA